MVVLPFVWLSASFNYYLIQFLVNTFEDVYVTGIGSGLADIIANTVSSIAFEKFGIKATISVGMGSSAVGGLVILFYALQHQTSWTFPLLVMFAKFGVSGTFALLYVSHGTLFPVLFSATALGMCNSVAKLFSAMSPLFAQMEEPTPMITFTILTALTCVAALFIQTDAKKSVKKQ